MAAYKQTWYNVEVVGAPGSGSLFADPVGVGTTTLVSNVVDIDVVTTCANPVEGNMMHARYFVAGGANGDVGRDIGRVLEVTALPEWFLAFKLTRAMAAQMGGSREHSVLKPSS